MNNRNTCCGYVKLGFSAIFFPQRNGVDRIHAIQKSRDWIPLQCCENLEVYISPLINETGKMKTNSNVGVEWFDQWGGVKNPQKM